MKVSVRASALLALTLSLVNVASASSPAQEEDPNRIVVDRIIDAALEKGESYEMLRALCRTAPHRLSGSKGAEKAVRWAKAKMDELGFDNVRLEPCTVPRWVRGDVEELVFTSPPELEGQTLPILALGGSVATPEEGVEASVVVVTSFEELQGMGEAAKGKIVLFNRPMRVADENTFRAYGGAVGQRVDGANQAARAGIGRGASALVRRKSG